MQLYEIPMIFVIGWRGFENTDAPEHIKIGKIQQKLLSTLGLKSKIMISSTTCHSGLNQGLYPRPPLAAPTENRAPGNSDCI